EAAVGEHQSLLVESVCFARIANASDLGRFDLNSLSFIMLGGESINFSDVEIFHSQWPHVRFMNHYGPTETTIGSIRQWLPSETFDQYKSQPTIGTPIHNTGAFVMGNHFNLMPVNAKGELCISGDGVARGYINKPELTTEKFIAVELRNSQFTRTYKTGDVARRLDSGNIELLGRTDNQVKIRGNRIEPDEIQRLLGMHPDVIETVVMAFPILKQMQLVAYVLLNSTDQNANEPSTGWEEKLREYLSASLPDFMIPAYFVPVATMPRNQAGKIDRKTLKAMDIDALFSERRAARETVPPRSETEKIMVSVWKQVLGMETIGITDNFFHIGGDSIKAIQVSAGLHKRGLKIKISDLFANPSIKALSPML
ncbi:MAG: non-ribosomal peptide synthetase, partial [Pseudomonadales bacterium]|nr:non-ribosomal peptide synthetase [Pseudomonadales bacterium]